MATALQHKDAPGAKGARREWLQRWFLLSAGVILAVTGIAKFLSAGGDAGILSRPDPIFGIPFGRLLFMVAVAEVLVASLCFLGRWPQLCTLAVTWLATGLKVAGYGSARKNRSIWLNLNLHWSNCFLMAAYVVTLPQVSQALMTSDDAAVEYSGLIERKMTTASSDEEIPIGRLEFTFYVDSRGHWAFEGNQTLPMAGRDDYTSRIVSGFNGVDIYGVHYAAANLNTLTGEMVPSPSLSHAIHPASVSPGATHFGENMWGSIPWFAFAASQHTAEEDLKSIPPLTGALHGKLVGQCYAPELKRGGASGLITNAIWRVIDGKQLSYKNLLSRPNVLIPESAEDVSAAVAKIREVRDKMRWRKVDSIYSVQVVGEVGGQEYPRRFTISQLTWEEHEPSDRNIATIYGTVTNARPVPVRSSVLPTLHGTQAVVDYRFPIRQGGLARDAIRYSLTDGTWIVDTNDFRLQAVSEQIRPTPIPRAPREDPWLRRMAIVGFVIVLIGPLLLLLRGRERRSNL